MAMVTKRVGRKRSPAQSNNRAEQLCSPHQKHLGLTHWTYYKGNPQFLASWASKAGRELNKKLKVGGGELKLPAKKTKGEKKPKWQAKTGKKAEPVVEAPVMEEQGSVAEQQVDAQATDTTMVEHAFMPTEQSVETTTN
jgi:hypothetical protein